VALTTLQSVRSKKDAGSDCKVHAIISCLCAKVALTLCREIALAFALMGGFSAMAMLFYLHVDPNLE
jgi:hypothetical protein